MKSATHTPHVRLMAISAVALSLALATGCHKSKPNYNLPPGAGEMAGTQPTAEITADPQTINVGQSVVINWRTTNATSATIDGIGAVNLNGTQTVSPTQSVVFHLVAKGNGGTAEASAKVTVLVPEAPTPPVGSQDLTDAALFAQNVQDVFFDYDSYEVRADGQAAIAKTAAFLNAHPTARVVIGGYCDDRGSAEYNLALGQNRANAAKNALVAAGVSADRLRVISYGKEKQFCSEETDACWQQNRRAQFSLDR